MAPFVVEQGLDSVLRRLQPADPPVLLYSGTVAEAAAKFPANVNVAVALALAGVGPGRTLFELWADPAVSRNTHTIKVDSAASTFEISVAGVRGLACTCPLHMSCAARRCPRGNLCASDGGVFVWPFRCHLLTTLPPACSPHSPPLPRCGV